VTEGGPATSRRLPFHLQTHGGVGRLVLSNVSVGHLAIERLELEVSDLGTDPGTAAAERFQRRRTQLRHLVVRITPRALDDRVQAIREPLGEHGITQLAARLHDGFVSLRARVADGLSTADLSFHVELLGAGAQLRAIASAIRVHGHLPTPGPVVADLVLSTLLGATASSDDDDRPHPRGLCDAQADLVGALLWGVLPPSGWRLPAVSEIELTHLRVARAAIDITYGPVGTRGGELGVRQHVHQLAAAHDLMHSVDLQLRDGQLDDAIRGYRALLASSGPDQPVVLERLLAVAAARPAWFFDGLELARQALGRWPTFAPAHAALASITLAQGDAREAASQLEQLARMASAQGDDYQAALAALAGARLLRVLDPGVATQLYQLAVDHDPRSREAADSLADRLADEQRWPELVRLLRSRIADAAEPPASGAGAAAASPTPPADRARVVQLHVRLAGVLVDQLGDPAGAHHELELAKLLVHDDPTIHEMTATVLGPSEPAAASAAWREVARLAEARDDHRTAARAWARLGALLAPTEAGDAEPGTDPERDAAAAWRRALELDPLQADALVGLAHAAAARSEHAIAIDLYDRLRELGLPQHVAARHELALARSLVALGRSDEARASLRRGILAGGETAAEAHAMLAEIAEAASDRDHAVAELETAISSLVALAACAPRDVERLHARAAELAVNRAMTFDKTGQSVAAGVDWQRAYALAQVAAPEIARDAARTLLARSGDDPAVQRRWIDAVLATQPVAAERAALLVRRADSRRRDASPDLAATLADLQAAVGLTEAAAGTHRTTRRRAFQIEAELFAHAADHRARAQALTELVALTERPGERVEAEVAAATAWLAADDPATALPHGARACAEVTGVDQVSPALRREAQLAFGEAAWRLRRWPDVVRAYRELVDEPGELVRIASYRYRLAIAADRTGEPATALAALRPLIDDPDAARGAPPELRAQALRLFADLAERAGELVPAAHALESFAAIGGDGSATTRADAVYRAGELLRRADRDDDAIRCFEAALRISEAHLPALDALEAAWRERRDLERVAAILGRKVAATARQSGRQKPLLSRLGDLQDQLGRPDVALATHQRALEIDPMWRPSLRYVTLGLRDSGQVVAAAGGLAQLAGELHGDQGVDLAIVTRERKIAAEALAELVARLDDAQLDAVRAVVQPALERAALDNADVGAGLARLRGDAVPATPATPRSEDRTPSGKLATGGSSARALRDAAARARAAGKLDDAFAVLETANHVNPGDVEILRELVELASELRDHAAVARHLTDLAHRLTGARRGDVLLELADTYYDKLDDAGRGRAAMTKAAEAFGAGSRRDATLRMLATEAATQLAWDVSIDALLAIPIEKRTQADFTSLATALMRAGRDADGLALIEAATSAERFDDGGDLHRQLVREIQRKIDLVRSLEDRAMAASAEDAVALLDEAQQLRLAIGQPGAQPVRDTAAPVAETSKSDTAPWPARTKTKPGVPSRRISPAPAGSRPSITLPPALADADAQAGATPPQATADAAAPVRPSGDPEPGLAAAPAAVIPDPAASIPGPAAVPAAAPRPASDPPAAVVLADPSVAADPLTVTTIDGDLAVPTAPPPVAVAHATSIEVPAGDAPAASTPNAQARATEPSEPAAAAMLDSASDLPRGRAGATEALPAIGRIQLVPRAVTRRGAGSDRPPASIAAPTAAPIAAPAAAELDDLDDSWQSVSNPELASGPILPRAPVELPAAPAAAEPAATPSVTITGSPDETALALTLAAASADRNLLFSARRADPGDPAMLLAILAHLGDREPGVRRELLDEVAGDGQGTALAIALHELALLARQRRDASRAAELWTRAHRADPGYPPVWMPLADALAAADDYATARELYDAVARSPAYDAARRAFAADRAEALGRDDSVVSGEIQPRAATDVEEAKLLAESEDWPGAIDAAERASAAHPNDTALLELLERIYHESGNVTAASEAIGRQLALADDPLVRAALWRRRARMYRDALGRQADAYRCIKEAHDCAPADPEIAYQLRIAAIVRGEWPLAASLIYREIAAASNPRDRGALHLELALIYEERLGDLDQAQANYEQALAFDPTIPAVKLPLARRYEAIGRSSDAARLYEDAAASARAADRATLLEAAARCRATATEAAEPAFAAQLDRAEAAGDRDAALELAHTLWRADPGHPAAFRVLANVHRASGDLLGLTELTRVRARHAAVPDERAAPWLEVARLAEEIGVPDQAASAYDLALIEDPGHTGALDARGALAFRLADYATADLIYRDLGPGESVLGDDELALRRSIIAEQLGRDTEALALARVAASLGPGRRDVMARVQELATRIGELPIAIAAAHNVLELVPIEDDDSRLTTQFALVELLRQAGQLDAAAAQLEAILRDYPVHAGVIEALAELHVARGDWASASRYLYQLVPLAPSPSHRAERLYQLGEVVLVHLGDVDRADDLFLRASDLDPGHVPTLRRLLDVYWRADDPGSIVEVATELAGKDALASGATPEPALAHALIAAALVGDAPLAQRIQAALGDSTPAEVAAALAELAGRTGRLQLATASTAVAELARRGVIDLTRLREAAAGTAVASSL
jgi:tetratricopeptide (TPR) repeat protein